MSELIKVSGILLRTFINGGNCQRKFGEKKRNT